MNELKSHLRLECETEWLEYSEQETSSSLDFSLSFWKQTNDGFRINLKNLCRNFVLIIDEMFMFFKQDADENWSVGLLDLKEHSVIDVHFSTIQSNNYSSTTILTLHSKLTLYELNLLQQMPSIPLEFATNLQSGIVGWTVTKRKHCPQIIILQAHSGKGLCRHIVKPLTMMTTQSPHQTVFIRLTMMKRGKAINPLKTT